MRIVRGQYYSCLCNHCQVRKLCQRRPLQGYLSNQKQWIFDPILWFWYITSDRSRVSYSLLHWYITSSVASETVMPKGSTFHEPSWKFSKLDLYSSCFRKLYIVSFHFICKQFCFCKIFIRPRKCLWNSHIWTELLDDER